MNPIFRILIVISGLLMLWQTIVIAANLPPYILPDPLAVALAFKQQSTLIITHTIPTLLETMTGLLLGIVSGCLAGFIISSWTPIRRWFLPLIIISQAVPTFAIAPMLVIWFGYGLASKIVMTVLMVFFPIASACHDGLQRTPPELLQLAKSMQASFWRQLYFIRIPAALPTLAAGIRIAAVAAPVGAIVGEWVGASRGLGYLMLTANARMQIDTMFAALIMIVIMALILYFSIDRLLRQLIWWT